jgi:hypothetical protein
MTAAVDAGLIKQDPAGFEFDDLAAADPAQAIAAIQSVLQGKVTAATPPTPVPTPTAATPAPTAPTPTVATPAPTTPAPTAATPTAATPTTPTPTATPAATPAAGTPSSNRLNLVMMALPITPEQQVVIDKITEEYNSTDPTADQLRSVTINLDDLSANTGIDKDLLRGALSAMWGNDLITKISGDTFDLSKLYKPRTATATATPTAATPATSNVTGIDPAAWAAMPLDKRIEMIESDMGLEDIALEVIKSNQAEFDALMPVDGKPLVLSATSPSYAKYSDVVKGAIISYLNARGLDTTGLADQLQGAVDHTLFALDGVKFKVDPLYTLIFNMFTSSLGKGAPSDTTFEGDEE